MRFMQYYRTNNNLPKAPYVLTILKGSNEVFIACFGDSRLLITGQLR